MDFRDFSLPKNFFLFIKKYSNQLSKNIKKHMKVQISEVLDMR